jgi:hypothetical protein
MALGSTQPLKEISTRNISWGVKVAGAYGSQTYHLPVPNVLKFWEPQPPGTLRACTGLHKDCFLLHYVQIQIMVLRSLIRSRHKPA